MDSRKASQPRAPRPCLAVVDGLFGKEFNQVPSPTQMSMIGKELPAPPKTSKGPQSSNTHEFQSCPDPSCCQALARTYEA
eukprot:2703035-Amphidinium_carterae.1